MRRSRHNIIIKYEYAIRQMKRKTKNNMRIHLPDRKLENDQSSSTLFHHYFRRILSHIWYTIIPSSSSDVESTAFATNQSWQLLLKILLHLKYVLKYKDILRLSVITFEELQRMHNVGLDICIGSAQLHKNNKIYYICRDEPLFDNPTLQNMNKYVCCKIALL